MAPRNMEHSDALLFVVYAVLYATRRAVELWIELHRAAAAAPTLSKYEPSCGLDPVQPWPASLGWIWTGNETPAP